MRNTSELDVTPSYHRFPEKLCSQDKLLKLSRFLIPLYKKLDI